ncbi:MAG: ABC transporter substrate-binding protein [Sulfolobales archaeon]
MNFRRAISKTMAIVIAAIVVIAVIAAVAVYITTVPPAPTPTHTPSPTPTPTTPTPTTPTPTTPVTPPKPALHTQVLYIIADDEMTRISLYKAGVADIAVVTPARWKDVNLTPVDGHKLLLLIDKEKPRLTIQYIMLNTMREPFNIPEVRQALAYAVPYGTILDQIFGGLYTSLYTIVPKGLPGYTEYEIIKYELNEAKAREILNKLKEEKGFDPSKYTITVIYNLGNTARAQIAALLQNYWTRLGFKVFVETYSWPEYLDRVDHFNYDVAILGWIPDYLDPDNYLMPFVWGGAEFKDLKYYKNVPTTDVGKYISKVERAVVTEKFIVVVGPAGTGATYTGPTGKPLIVVSYVLDEDKTAKNWEEPIAFVTIGAAGWKDVPVSALVKLSRMVLDPEVREAIINAAVIVFNNEAAMILLGQAVTGRNYGSWVQNMYYPLSAFARYDLVWETHDAPVKDTGVLGIKNDPQTMVIATIGWPDTFDPAKSYESFGWEVFWQIYSKPVTYRYEEVEPEPELAVAWAFSKDATELYFVIRGNVVAYDPWSDKTYPIDATDVLFSAWRVVRLNLPGSAAWMFSDFIDMDASQVLTETEFEKALAEGLVAVYRGKESEVKSLSELLKFFGYQGPTAGVVKFKLYFPYPPILHIFTTAIASVIPMEYALGDKYSAALADSRNGKDPSAWAKYVIPGEEDPTYRLLKDRPVSTGPYYVADYREGSYILLKLNKYYWNATIWQTLYGYKP